VADEVRGGGREGEPTGGGRRRVANEGTDCDVGGVGGAA